MTKSKKFVHCPDRRTHCPDGRTIRGWVENGPEGMDVADFQHLFQCDKCRDRWRFGLEYRLYKNFADEYIPTDEDVALVKEFLAQKHEEEERWICLTDKLARRYKTNVSKLGSVGNVLLGFAASFMIGPAMVASGYNVNEQLYSSDDKDLTIVFIANCSDDDPHYWQAELTIPSETTQETLLPIFVSDYRRRPIESGKFVLFNQELKIECGMAEISFVQFMTNFKKHSVKLVFEDEQETKGTLRYY